MNGLQLHLRDRLENPGTDLLIGDLQIQHDLGDLPKRVNMSGQSFAVRGMARLLGTLRSPEDARDQIIKRGQQAVEQLLLKFLEVTD